MFYNTDAYNNIMIGNIKLILVCLLLVAASTVPTCARLPTVGDNVRIYTAGMIAPLSYEGNIKEIGNGFVDLMCNEVLLDIPEDSNYHLYGKMAELSPPKDICIGIGAIIRLEWI